MFKSLFTPIKIRDMELKNRVIMPAMGTRMANEKSEITERLVAYHEARARGGCGLNIVEVSSVHTPSAPAHFVSISEDIYIRGHRQLTDAIHHAGGRAGIQLWQGSIAVMMDSKAKIFVPSDMPFGTFTVPAMTVEEIEEIIQCYGAAARRSAEAGYDCIEFHCAHNYLPHSFLSGGFNRRTDAYGGSFENRARFPLACIRAIRENIPEGMPLFMRIGVHDDYLQNGLTIEETIAFCKLAKEAGVDVLDISRGNIITPASIYEVPPIDITNGFNVDNASRIRKETGMLTVAVGRINTAQLADEILAQDKVDMVVMGRAQLADPEFCNKAQEGRTEEIIHCVGCNQGCYDGFCDVRNRPFITCLRNPMLGHEKEYKLEPATHSKKVLIVGGGMAGMEAAMLLKERGHIPVVYEVSDHLGGQFVTAGQAPGKAEMKEAARALGKQIERKGIDVHYQMQVNAAILEKEKPDEMIIAIGASPIMINLPGIENKPVYKAHDVLDGKCTPEGSVCVIGGGLVGLEVADALATKGHLVKIIEMKEQVGADLGNLRKIAVMQKMQSLNVEILTKATCVAVQEQGICIEIEGEKQVVCCDSIVVAVGAKPNEHASLVALCEEKKIPYHIIGDAKSARRAMDAIEEGFNVARQL
ncbi:NADH oxidase [Sporanaerobium hydrogeniformans]|uniref:NADH oxidase n=1 Tax=Sporanaerobium hydrogeniformans TaxID=3072179 RepID=A0AC61DHW4_9FIRM|nr:FAD-dependent oxidoreductase [Sporanaerobium hydrogeniformans]PHV72221.1 NADH oxidase [Sporanaerobium hydrogeniformans]